MADLRSLVRGYLTSSGFRVLEERGDCVVADRLVFGQERDTWLVFTVPEEGEPSAYEATLRASISSVSQNYPDAKAYVLASSRGGFSRDMLQTFADLRIKLLVPVWFFDTPFNWEEARKVASALLDIRSLAQSQKRVPQPFTVEDGDVQTQNDLFEQLRTELSRPDAATVRIIVGRAGMGKSVLFRALYDHMYGAFQSAKRQQRTMPRPIPLLPEHLKATYGLRTEALIETFLRTEVAAPVTRETFEWLLVNGFHTWLLDGIDELYAGDPGFFDYLLDVVTRRDSKAQVTMWCRDSVLTTSRAFADFRDYCAGQTELRIYRLSDWERPSKRQFAWIRLEEHLPEPSEQDTSQVRGFMIGVDRNQTVRSLSGLPFYCDLLLQQHQAGGLHDFTDDVALLNHVIDEMIAREVAKGLLDMRFLVPDGLKLWLEQIAVDYVEAQRYAAINSDQAKEYGELVLQDDLDDEIRDNILISLLQFPLFRAGEKTGLIAFAHDLIAETLAARAYMRLLAQRPIDVATRLTGVDLEDPTLLRFMASGLDTAAEKALVKEMRRGSLPGRAFAVALSLMQLARPGRDLIKGMDANLEGQDLAAVRFERRDLSSLSFRHSDLSYAVFKDCNLEGARFQGAFMERTRFDGKNELRGAEFGDMSRIQSVLAGRRFVDDPKDIRAWVAKATGSPAASGEPCPTALQVSHMFGKFITPLGEPRRAHLNRDGLLSGRRFAGAAPSEACLEEAVKAGYFSGPDDRSRFRRAAGDKYAEMVAFVKDESISDGIGQLIAGLCRKRSCLHQLHP